MNQFQVDRIKNKMFELSALALWLMVDFNT